MARRPRGGVRGEGDQAARVDEEDEITRGVHDRPEGVLELQGVDKLVHRAGHPAQAAASRIGQPQVPQLATMSPETVTIHTAFG